MMSVWHAILHVPIGLSISASGTLMANHAWSSWSSVAERSPRSEWAAEASPTDRANSLAEPGSTASSPVVYGLRKFPYPYQAMLAVSSDADHQTIRKLWLIHAFLNTSLSTPLGRGLGLDVADSFYMFNGTDLQEEVDINRTPISQQLSYYAGTGVERSGANFIEDCLRHGWMDTMHTYGDFSARSPARTQFRRDLAVQAVQSLQAAGATVLVWVDHGNQANVSNFGSRDLGPFFAYQQGADPASPYYHTDVLIPYGVRYVWMNRDGNVFGHDSMITPMKLPDGQKVWGFPRFTNIGWNHPSGTEWVWTVDDFAKQASPQRVHALESHHQYAVLAQHLCADNTALPLPKSAVSAFRFLAREQSAGRLLVARTSRLLTYNTTEQDLYYEVNRDSRGYTQIHIRRIDDPVVGPHTPSISELRGITFYTSNPDRTELCLGDTPVSSALVQINPSDGTSPSIGVRWFGAGR